MRGKEVFPSPLRQLRESGSLQDQAEAMDALDGFLKEQQFKRSQQPFDPNKLPFGTPDPNKTRQPATDKQKLNELLGLNKSPSAGEQLLDAVVSPAYAQSSNQPAPADLEETIDVQITEGIQAKADELNNDPVAIYNWVRNNIEFLPTYGSIQGSDMTLQTERGNPFDTASLLIALLRASDIPARYAYGTVRIPVDKVMNWVGGVEVPEAAMSILGQGGIPNTGYAQGGQITHIQMEHVWVEAWVDYMPSRGARHVEGDTWIPLDGSFKQYDYTDGVNVQDQVPFDAQTFADTIVDSATIDEDAGTVEGIDQQYIQDQLSQYQTQVEQFIDTQHPEATVGEVIGTKTIRQENRPILASGLPYNQLATSERFSAIPDNLRHKYRFQLQDRYGSPLFSEVLDLPAIANSTIALSFSPATEADEQTLQSFVPDNITDISQLPDSIPGYLVNVQAELVIDQQEQDTGVTLTMGDEVTLNQALYNPQDGWETTNTPVVAGEYHAIGVSGAGIGAQKLERLQDEAQSVQAILQTCQENGDCSAVDNLNRHQVIGSVLQAGVMGWFGLTETEAQLAAIGQNVIYQPLPSYGKFGSSADVQYSWGVPRYVGFSGVLMDIDFNKALAESMAGDRRGAVDYIKAIGSQRSANEHLVPEQIFSTDDTPRRGVSAVKALRLAGSESQLIYTLSQSNSDQLANIDIDAIARTEIRNAIDSGQHVIVHEQPIQISGWSGSGYIISDPETGSGAYKISGGANGGHLGGAGPLFNALGYLGIKEYKWINVSPVGSLVDKALRVFGVVSALVNFSKLKGPCGAGVAAAVAALLEGIDRLFTMIAFAAALGPVGILTGVLIMVGISMLIAMFQTAVINVTARACNVLG